MPTVCKVSLVFRADVLGGGNTTRVIWVHDARPAAGRCGRAAAGRCRWLASFWRKRNQNGVLLTRVRSHRQGMLLRLRPGQGRAVPPGPGTGDGKAERGKPSGGAERRKPSGGRRGGRSRQAERTGGTGQSRTGRARIPTSKTIFGKMRWRSGADAFPSARSRQRAGRPAIESGAAEVIRPDPARHDPAQQEP